MKTYKQLLTKIIDLADLAHYTKFFEAKVQHGVKPEELLRTPNPIDRQILQIITMHNDEMHKKVEDAYNLLGQNYLKNITPMLFKINDLKEILEKRIQKHINRDEILDISIKKFTEDEKPAMFLYAYFNEGLQPVIVLIRPDEIDHYDGSKYIQACRRYSMDVCLNDYFKEFAQETIELDPANLENILFSEGTYNPNLLTVTDSKAIREITQKMYAAYPYKSAGHDLPDLKRVIYDIYDYIKTDKEIVESLANGYYIFKNKYKLINEPVQFLENRDLIVHYLVQAAGLEKYALENLKNYYFEQGSLTDMREIERFYNKQNLKKHKLYSFYTLERTEELINILKSTNLDNLQEIVKKNIETSLTYLAELLEKMKNIQTKLNEISLMEGRESQEGSQDKEPENKEKKQNLVINTPKEKTILRKIIDFISSFFKLFFSMESSTTKEITSTNQSTVSKSAGIPLGKNRRISSTDSKRKINENTLGVKNDQLVESYIKKELLGRENGLVIDLLPKVILTEEELKTIKDRVEKKLNLAKELEDFSNIKIYQVMTRLIRAIEIIFDPKKINLHALPQKYKARQKVYILIPGVKPLAFLEQLKNEYYQKYDGQAELSKKTLYAYVLGIAEEKIRRNGN